MNIQFNSNKQITDEIQVTVEYSQLTDEVTNLLKYLNNFENKDYIVVNVDKAHHIISKQDIEYIEVNVDLVTLKTTKEIYQFRYRLYKILEDINSPNFIQVSKYCVINMDYLVKIETSFYGNIYAILKDNKRISISRTYYKNIKNYLKI